MPNAAGDKRKARQTVSRSRQSHRRTTFHAMADVAPDDPGEWMQWRFRDPHASAGEPGSPNHARYEFARQRRSGSHRGGVAASLDADPNYEPRCPSYSSPLLGARSSIDRTATWATVSAVAFHLRCGRPALGSTDPSIRYSCPHEIKANGRWVDRMRRRTWAAVTLGGAGTGPADDLIAGVFSGSVGAATKLRESGGLHGLVDRPHSSQRFSLDVFGSLDESGVRKLLTPFFGAIRSARQPRFDWTDEPDALGTNGVSSGPNTRGCSARGGGDDCRRDGRRPGGR